MKIEPFKMKVTPEQSKRVQEILFKNGYSWTGDDTSISMLWRTHLYFRGKFLFCGQSTEWFKDVHELSEITYQEFIDKYEFELPEKWGIHPTTIEEARIVGKYFDEYRLGIILEGENFYEKNANLILDGGIGIQYGLGIPSSFKKITFEQFKKYVLKEESFKVGDEIVGKQFKITSTEGEQFPIFHKDYYCIVEEINNDKLRLRGDGDLWFYQKDFKLKEETMDKKIIGYKLIKPEYKEAALKISNTVGNWENSLMNYDISISQTGYINRLKNAGVLDLWFEPVYEAEENFNVGDWVTYIKGGIPPYTTQIQSIGHDGWIYSNINKPDGGHYHYSQYRKATPEEIKTAQEIKMPFGNIEVVVTKDYVIYTRENVKVEFSSVSDFLASIDKDRYLSKKLGTFKITITDDALIKIGCEIGTLGQIRDIYDKMKELQ